MTQELPTKRVTKPGALPLKLRNGIYLEQFVSRKKREELGSRVASRWSFLLPAGREVKVPFPLRNW